MRRIALILGILAVVAVAAAGGAWLWLEKTFEVPGPLADDTTVIIPKGAGTSAIAGKLMSAGIIDDADVFKLGHRLFAAPGSLRAGEFRIPSFVSMADVVRILQSGKTVVRKVTIAEGLTNLETVDLLNRAAGLVGLPGPLPGEGRLLPETYHFSYGDARAALVKRMGEANAQLMAELWPRRAPDLPVKTPAEALVLASIVEKETGVASERPRVAAVFHNRLRRGMKLQSDPTVIYGLTQGAGPLGRPITKADLKSETAYNTYVIKGLPPTPIANPGRAAIEAVLNPATTKELYFVADGTGGHAFAETLAQHNRNVAKWRKIERARKKKAP